MSNLKIKTTPAQIFGEYRTGDNYKQSLGKSGICEQGKINERFFVGDHWHGAKCGNSRPLVRRNIIKRIGEFKISSITAAPLAVNYTAEGIPNINTAEQQELLLSDIAMGNLPSGEVSDVEICAVMRELSDYFKVTAERVRLDILKEQALRNAYISGTGLLYTYWDSNIKTGLFADNQKKTQIMGDINCEVLQIENVVFGEPNNEDIQSQPYIIISRRRHISDVIRQAKQNKISAEQLSQIKPDDAGFYGENAGQYGEQEPLDSKRVTTLTKFYKLWNDEGTDYKVMCVECTEKAIIRKPFDTGIKYYPFAILPWERRRSCIYGESEITYLVPNQIAINRCLTSAVWSLISTGMPIMIVNGDIVSGQVTNEPGQIIKIFGTSEDTAGAIRYVQPPVVQSQYLLNVNEMASSTLNDSGANDAALGNLRPDNASAIIQMREAAMAPMQMYMNRFYDFIEQTARIWADFWLNFYGQRSLKTVSKEGTNYIPFDAERYKNLVINARIDVGAATLWSEAVVISTLDGLLQRNLISFEQYLDRLPKGIIPDVTGLKKDLEMVSATMQQPTMQQPITQFDDQQILDDFAVQQPELFEKFKGLPEDKQNELLGKVRGAYNGEATEIEMVGDL